MPGCAVYTSSSGVIGVRDDLERRRKHGSGRQLQNLSFKSEEADPAVMRSLTGSRLEVVTVIPGGMNGPSDIGPTRAGQRVLHLPARKLPGLPDGFAERTFVGLGGRVLCLSSPRQSS